MYTGLCARCTLSFYNKMNFSLVFDNTNDLIPFESVSNAELIEFFIDQANKRNVNSFSDDTVICNNLDRCLNDVNWALSKTNEVLYALIGKSFPQSTNLLDYLDQTFLNRQHEQWVFSQQCIIDIDQLRFSSNATQSRLGNILHDKYPDHIRKIRLAEAMSKLGYIYPYEEVNMTVHRLENFFSNQLEFKSDQKWEVFNNPFLDSMVSNNDRVNFSFGYTYVGRQYYDKWQFFDTDLDCQDHYNYETLEWAFQINLARPETIAYSPEFLDWCREKNVKPIARQIPLANIVDLEKNLHYYRSILYKNSRAGNRASLLT